MPFAAASATNQLLSLTRQRALAPQPLDIGRRIPELRDILTQSLRGDISIGLSVPDGACVAMIDPTEFEMALINLAVNARDAMPQGGRFNITARRVELAGEPDGLSGQFVEIVVSDTGTGIPADVLPNVFNPFFTTKPDGKGTGLGLSQVYGFAHRSGGTATIESAQGLGTTVTLYLPCGDLSDEARMEDETSIVAFGAGRRVLLVDDNAQIASVTRGLLEELGFAVRWAENAADGLRSVETEPIDLVLSDIVMPGAWNGLDLARELRSRRPQLPIVLATGYSASSEQARTEGFVVLAKPYDMARLASVLRAALAGTRAPAVKSGASTASAKVSASAGSLSPPAPPPPRS